MLLQEFFHLSFLCLHLLPSSQLLTVFLLFLTYMVTSQFLLSLYTRQRKDFCDRYYFQKLSFVSIAPGLWEPKKDQLKKIVKEKYAVKINQRNFKMPNSESKHTALENLEPNSSSLVEDTFWKLWWTFCGARW